MTMITLNDELIKQVIATSHFHNAEEAVIEILSDYLRQQKKELNITELLAMPDVADIDFDPPRLTSNIYSPVNLS